MIEPRRSRGSNVRRPETEVYQHLYLTKAWRTLRAQQLEREPWCAECAKDGRKSEASIADHLVPHKGNRRLFFRGKLQSLCIIHHNEKTRVERGGKPKQHIGADGWPLTTT
jgi:hypothetical protein